MPEAKINWEILEDGTISISTDGVPGEHHKAADELLDEIQQLTGGERTVTKKKGPKVRHHHHTHDHVHEGHHH